MIYSPSIDIIIPNYNKAKYLNECLDSVLKQTYKNWKIYLVDDFSNDNSKEILNKFKNDPRISITYLESNHGPAFCRNLGIEKSSSELLAFLDSDDFWPIDKLQIQITNMLKNDNDFTYTDFKFFFNENFDKLKTTSLPIFYDLKNFLKNSTMSTSSIILKRKIIDEIKFKDYKHEDFLFKCDILRKGITSFKINNTFTYYRINKSNRSSSKLENLLNLWIINKKGNNLNFLQNIKSVLSISLSSLKNYGWK